MQRICPRLLKVIDISIMKEIYFVMRIITGLIQFNSIYSSKKYSITALNKNTLLVFKEFYEEEEDNIYIYIYMQS